MIAIDGSRGEGGGRILRTALGLSCLFREPFRMFNVLTNLRVAGLFRPFRYDVDEESGKPGRARIRPS